MLAAKPDQGFWVHLDVDVLDQAIMPAVDCPGSPGIPPEDLVAILQRKRPVFSTLLTR